MDLFKKAKSFLAELTEIGFLLVALGIVAGILTGGRVPFLGDIVGNITAFVGTLGDSGLVGLMSLGLIAWVFSKR